MLAFYHPKIWSCAFNQPQIPMLMCVILIRASHFRDSSDPSLANHHTMLTERQPLRRSGFKKSILKIKMIREHSGCTQPWIQNLLNQFWKSVRQKNRTRGKKVLGTNPMGKGELISDLLYCLTLLLFNQNKQTKKRGGGTQQSKTRNNPNQKTCIDVLICIKVIYNVYNSWWIYTV